MSDDANSPRRKAPKREGSATASPRKKVGKAKPALRMTVATHGLAAGGKARNPTSGFAVRVGRPVAPLLSRDAIVAAMEILAKGGDAQVRLAGLTARAHQSPLPPSLSTSACVIVSFSISLPIRAGGVHDPAAHGRILSRRSRVRVAHARWYAGSIDYRLCRRRCGR